MRLCYHKSKKYANIKKGIMRINKIESNSTYPAFGLKNSKGLRTLFSYGLPCMYTGVEMIDSKNLLRMVNKHKFETALMGVSKLLEPYAKTLSGIELGVYNIIRMYSKSFPRMGLQSLFMHLAPKYEKRLITIQAPIIKDLSKEAQELPDDYRFKVNQLIAETEDKIYKRPVKVPYSEKEFIYKLEKIKKDIKGTREAKNIKIIDKILKNPDNIENIKVYYKPFQKLIDDTRSQKRGEKIISRFSRKSFIYDLANVLETYPDKVKSERMLQIAKKLPTSRDSAAAYIVKYSSEPSNKIGFRILDPYVASVEHILPAANGGEDEMYNYGGACKRVNSDRGNIDFTEQIKRMPKTGFNCKNYVIRLVDLLHRGIFEKHNINPKYIDDFKSTVERESKGQITFKSKRA